MDNHSISFGPSARYVRFLLACLCLSYGAGAFGSADLALTEYSSSPDNTSIPNQGLVTFTARANNFGPDTVTDGKIRITVSALTEITTTPAGCVLSGAFPTQELTCDLPNPFAINDSATISYTARAEAVGTGATLARAFSAAISDTSNGNDSESLALTVLSSGDLTLTKNASTLSAPAGSSISYSLTPNNAGPNNHSSLRVIDTLPSATDFTFQAASGTDWSCSHANAVVTCDYSGAGFIGAAPDISISGTIVKAVEGTITNIAAIESTSATTLDSDTSNNTSDPVVVTVTPGADIAAGITLPATLVTPDAGTLQLSLSNQGPMDVPAGSSISTTVPASLTIVSVPAGCSQSGSTISCVADAISASGSQSFVATVSASTPSGAETISASASIAASVTDPNPGNDNISASFEVVPPNADLALSKAKSPDPVSAGDTITNTVTIRNNGPSPASYTPANPILVVDTLGANETFVASPTAGFGCSVAGSDISCSTTGTGSLAVNDTLELVITTQAGATVDEDISNTVCANSSAHTPSDHVAGNNCATASVRATTQAADLSIAKEVSLSAAGPWSQSGLALDSTDTGYFIRLQVTNNELAGGSVARNVAITDNIEHYVNETISSAAGDVSHQTSISVQTPPINGTCNIPASSGSLSCSLTDLNPQETRTLILQVDRSFDSGSLSNTASVSSADTTDSVSANNSATATFTAVGVADIVVDSKVVSPTEPRAGQRATYIINIKNLGANPATAVTLTDDLDETLFASTGSLPQSTKPGSSCSLDSLTLALTCNMGTFERGDTYQVSFDVQLRYPFGGASNPADFPTTYTNTASVSTTSVQLPGHQTDSTALLHNVLGPSIDLRVTTQEPDASYDPTAFGNQLTYDLRISNAGESRATNVEVTDTPSAPSGYSMTFASLSVNPTAASSGFSLRSAPNASCTGSPLICRIDGTASSSNYLDPGEQVVLRLLFDIAGAEPTSTLAFTNSVSGSATEDAFDLLPANNSASQTTSVVPRTDLELLSNTRLGAEVRNINEPISYEVMFRNNGPTATSQVRITQALPSGFTLFGTPTLAPDPGSAATSTGISCSGTSSVVCTLNGNFTTAPGDTLTLSMAARAQHPYTQALETDRISTASIDVGLDLSGEPLGGDSVSSNNAASAATQIQAASISGQVYSDNNRSASPEAGEGINGATVTLAGTDLYGNSLSNVTATTSSDGTFSLDRLPPGTSYSLVGTQPADHFDGDELAGTGGGSVDNSSYGSNPGENTIGNIGLDPAEALSGYRFQELAEASVAGAIYADANNDGSLSGEVGIAIGAGNEVRLTGTDYAGNAVDRTANLDGSGLYRFDDLPPSDASGYNLKQEVAPTGYFDGLDENGSGVVIANSSGRSLSNENIPLGVVNPAAALTNRNFGELGASSLSGMVYLDLDNDAERDPDENAGFAGAVLTLTGTNDLNETINCSITTTSTGTFSFPISGHPDPLCQSLRPGTYNLAETPPSGLTHSGAFIGSAGGAAGGQSGADTPVPGAAILSISNIPINPSTTASGYNFGERGDGLSGSVYIDSNNDGERGPNEVGIPGVTITLSGNLANAQSVCTVVTCAVTTDAAGNFSYPGLSDSDATGYSLAQQSQASPPLVNYADGIDSAGDVGGASLGTAGNDQITNIVIAGNMLAQNFRFGERASALAGTVYVDSNNDAAPQAGEPPIANATLTLSGTTLSGDNICTHLAALSPARSCDATTDNAGEFNFADLPAGSYNIAQGTQPAAYADGLESAGSAGGNVDNTPGANSISSISLGTAATGTGYHFGERGGSLSGKVAKDTNRDGVLTDPSDTPIPGVTLTLQDSGSNPVATTATLADGSYRFEDLAAGSYNLVETQPPGYGSSTPNTQAVILSAGGTASADFGDTLATMAGSVFIDADTDGVRDPAELGLANVNINLTGTDAASNAVSLDLLTDANGDFQFVDLLAGTYTLAQTQPNGYADGLDSLGSAGGTLSNDNISAIGLAEAVDATAYGFGENGQALSGSVYIDENGNGTREANEAGIPGVRVTLAGTTANGNDVCTFVSCEQTSDASGNYQYLNLPGSNPAGYRLTQQDQSTPPLSNYADGQDSAGSVAGATRGTAGNDQITGIQINSNDTALGYNFGELAIGLSGAVYADSNDSGVQDPTEPGISGVSITLSGTTTSGDDICTFLGALVPSRSCLQQTASNGSFLFPDIPAGSYTLTQTQPSGYLDGRENPGNPAGTVNNASFGDTAATNRIANISLTAGQTGSAYTFGERGGAITGVVFQDEDRNGTQEATTDIGISGVQLNLHHSSGNLVGSTSTAADGSFGFANLAAGDYQVEEVQPAGYGSSTPDTASLSLAVNGNATVSFGDTLSTIAGAVYIDVDGNGSREPAEPGLPDVEISLSGTDAAGASLNRTETTAADGSYRFDGVLAGTYSIIETHPADFTDGAESAGNLGGDIGDDRIDNIVIGTGVDASGYNFGEVGQLLQGTVYLDLNRNGAFDPEEPGLGDVTIELRDANDLLLQTLTTDTQGGYQVPNLAAGDYRLVQQQPAGYGSSQENGSNIALVTLVVGEPIAPVNFGEAAGSISGSVFNDRNSNGLQDSNEPGIPAVTLSLIGTGEDGAAINLTTSSNADGSYRFPNLVAGVYDLSQTQPSGFTDGPDYLGSAGGSLGNDNITNISLAAGADGADYQFTESGNLSAIEGSIWRDSNHNRVRDAGEEAVAGWTVRLYLGATLLRTATTDSNGQYQFGEITAGGGYRLAFMNPTSNAEFGGAQPNESGANFTDGQVAASNPGGAVINAKTLTQLKLLPGETLSQQSLPLDPSGIVYDAVTRLPLADAQVTLSGPAGFDADQHLVGGAGNLTQTTGADGLYQYLLLPGAPTGDYLLNVAAPQGTHSPVSPSSLVPPCPGNLTVGPTPNPLLIQASNAPPPAEAPRNCSLGTNSTAYYLGFNIDVASSAEILQNHIPVDPILEDAILVSKQTAKTYATRGDLVPYRITATNTLPGTLNDVQLVDRIPPGFKYRAGSARIDGVSVAPQVRGNELVWSNLAFATGQQRELSVLLVVGSGASEGKKTNYAYAFNPLADTSISNLADATVRVIPDPNTDCTDIIGKVFDDKNANGYQDRGEPGLAGVRVVTVRGLLITTDANGRYHIACPYIANEEYGSNFIVKLDTRTLPLGYRLTTDNPHTKRIARGKFVKMNFGAANMPVVRIDVNADAFAGELLGPGFDHAIWQMVKALEQQPTVLRIVYTSRGESKGEIARRIKRIRGSLANWWSKAKRRQHLIIEEEVIKVRSTGGADD